MPVKQIRKVAVLGAGTMGSRIAAHIANAGVPVVLLDMVLPGTAVEAGSAARNKLALAALDGLKKSKPAAFYTLDSARLITPGNFDDDMQLVADCDWIVEAVAENLYIKRALLAKVVEHRRAGSIVTTNTSGLPVASVVEGMPEELRRHWFIVSLITQTLKPASQQIAHREAFVITGEGDDFSVGANLMQLLLAMQDEEWDEVELAVRAFQNMTQAIKFCSRPVVVAPYGMCLGGGAEIALHAARHPHAELYIGLVEASDGLISAGGGCKEMLFRAIDGATAVRGDGNYAAMICRSLRRSRRASRRSLWRRFLLPRRMRGRSDFCGRRTASR